MVQCDQGFGELLKGPPFSTLRISRCEKRLARAPEGPRVVAFVFFRGLVWEAASVVGNHTIRGPVLSGKCDITL